MQSFILERLDRCLANETWISTFPDASIFHLDRAHYDHYLFLLQLIKEQPLPPSPSDWRPCGAPPHLSIHGQEPFGDTPSHLWSYILIYNPHNNLE